MAHLKELTGPNVGRAEYCRVSGSSRSSVCTVGMRGESLKRRSIGRTIAEIGGANQAVGAAHAGSINKVRLGTLLPTSEKDPGGSEEHQTAKPQKGVLYSLPFLEKGAPGAQLRALGYSNN